MALIVGGPTKSPTQGKIGRLCPSHLASSRPPSTVPDSLSVSASSHGRLCSWLCSSSFSASSGCSPPSWFITAISQLLLLALEIDGPNSTASASSSKHLRPSMASVPTPVAAPSWFSSAPERPSPNAPIQHQRMEKALFQLHRLTSGGRHPTFSIGFGRCLDLPWHPRSPPCMEVSSSQHLRAGDVSRRCLLAPSSSVHPNSQQLCFGLSPSENSPGSSSSALALSLPA